MDTGRTIVTELRQRAGLSQRALAERAGCTRSTIARIENGDMDPTITMLARIAAATGHRLALDTTQTLPRHSLAAIATQHTDADIPWTALRGLVDWAQLHPDTTQDLISDPPPRTGNDHLDNLLAGVADKLADDQHLPRPTWTSDVHPAHTAWQTPGTPRMQQRERANTPSQLATRSVFIGADNLWRPTHG